MGVVVLLPCRSYAAQAFDGCPGCVGAALEAVGQASLYVLGRSAADLMGGLSEPLEISYRLAVRLVDEMGLEIGTDELDADQTVGWAEPTDDFAEPAGATDGAEAEDASDRPSMGLEDFQTVLERIELEAVGTQGVRGAISGRLFGFDQPIGRFEVQVRPF